MRISHVITSLGTGGAETLVVNLSLKQRELGHEVEIATLSDAGGIPRQTAESAELPIHDLGHDARDIRAITRLPRAVAHADIVHVHLFPALYIAAAARISQPRIYTEHSTHNKRRGKSILHPLERLMYGRYAQLVAISNGVADSLTDYLGKLGLSSRVSVIPNAIGDTFFSRPPLAPRAPQEPLRLIAVGTLDDRKNFASAVSAVATAPGTMLDIVGAGPLESELRSQIDRLGVADRVRLLGRREDVARLMDDHDVLLSTSRYEGFGLVAAEAMARGLPVVGPDVAGFRDVVSHGETGLLYPSPSDPNEIATVVALLADRGEYARLSRNAVAKSDQFSLVAAARAHLELYSRLCSVRSL